MPMGVLAALFKTYGGSNPLEEVATSWDVDGGVKEEF